MNPYAKFSLICLLPLAMAGASRAQNLLTNPDFLQSFGMTPWVTGSVGAAWSFGDDSGTCVGSVSAAGLSVPVGDSQALKLYNSDCFAVDSTATPQLYLGGRYKTTANVWVRFYLQFFGDGTCGSHLTWSEQAYADNSASWRYLVGTVQVPEAAGSAYFWLDFNPKVSGLSQFEAAVDSLYAGSTPQLFADSFEFDSGSACRWSTVVGAGS